MNAMRSLAKTFGPKGVVANSVAPGPVETEMMRSIPQDRKNRLKAATISQRFCSTEEVAEVICWLATDAPKYINGEVIDMNNGTNYTIKNSHTKKRPISGLKKLWPEE